MPMRVIMRCIAEKYTTLKRNGYDNEKTSNVFAIQFSAHVHSSKEKGRNCTWKIYVRGPT